MDNHKPDMPYTNAIDESRALYRTIFENTGTATILIEADMTISLVNSELTRISGIEKDRVEGKMKFPELIAEEDRERVRKNHLLRRRDPDKAPRNYPCRVKLAKGKIKECLLTVALVDGTDQSVASITDLSRQKQLERQVAKISDQERQHMGRLLHDDLGSHLAGVEAMAALLAARLSKSGHADSDLALEIKGLINQAIKKTKSLVQGMLPVDLAKTGFMQALRQYAQGVQNAFSITCLVKGDLEGSSLSLESLTHLYYIVREAVNNAARHARADRIEIRFDQTQDGMIIQVKDNGKGLDPQKGNKTGVGLQIMVQRADLIEAHLTIEKNKRGGTTVRCRIKNKYAS